MTQPPRLNPLTPLTLAVCGMVVVLVANSWVVSAVMWGLCALVCIVVRTPRRSLVTAAVISLPAFIGFGLMYAPFNGLDVALALGLRFLAATTVALVCGSFVDLDELMRTLQTRLPAKLVYIIGSTARLYPMARQRLRTIREVRSSRGVPVRGFRANCSLVLPLVVGLVDDAAQRARPLQRTGIGEPGPRTVLRPVGETRLDWAIRIGAVVFTAVVVALVVA
ncbi:energy-coupling factor transporter transmembrane protein EcfT [Corynebacterium falsenii]|uniref:Energy-coupling factor transporter transmembrane protein EcfT n=1 Tax=Corynebacterium falsenii TaxID=108486 RepID=A0A418Q4V7_9CORY|nr:energy-coupling factor transporter transmembrane component T [Corynebacterium falsenii]RIX33444.1 energy-coupling factor transporter transmembrane protein EcfT [Corynebacterium falsenii]